MPALPLEPDDPREIGRHRLTGRLGEGGQGVVYLGEAPDGQRVAVKVLKTTSDSALARFAREMQAAQRVAPFCTAAVLESSATGRHPYVVSEFVDGPSLQQRVFERGPLRGGDLDRLMVNTASGLTAIHGAGIVHRDLKPANVLLGPDGPRVVDFGIARAVDAETHTQMVGTPAYFAPEWLRGEPPTPASDVFAWAGTMVFAATGRPPFGGGSNIPALMHRISTEAPDLSGVPDRLQGLLAECLDKDPARRPTARALLVRLADPSADSGAMPQPPAPPARVNSPHAMVPPGAMGPPTQPPAQPPWQHGGPAGPHQDTVARTGTTKGRGRTGLLVASAVVVTAILLMGTWFLLANRNDGKEASSSDKPPANNSSSNSAPKSSSAPHGGPAIPKEFSGTWKGKVTQPAGLSASTGSDVTIVLKDGAADGKANYGSWGCENTLKLTSASGSALDFEETVVRDRPDEAACQGGGLKLTLQNGKLLYHSPGLAGTTTGTLSHSG